MGLDVCVASSIAAAVRGDAAQAAFDRKTSHYRRAIPNHRAQDIVYRPLVWTADGRPHPAVTRTPQRSRHRVLPQWTANDSKNPPTQMETRNSNGPPPTESSHDTSSPTKHISKRVLVQPPPASRKSSCTLLHSKGTPAAYLSYLQPSQRYLCDDNLMTSQNSIPPNHSAGRTQRIQDAATANSAHTHGLDRHLPSATYPAATATARPSLSITTRNIR